MLFQKSIWADVTDKIDLLLIIHDVRLAIRESEVSDGMMTIYVPDGKGAIILAPEGFEKDRQFVRWLEFWMGQKGEVPKREYIGFMLGSSLTLPVEDGKLAIDPHTTVYMVDFTDKDRSRREFRVSIFTESEKEVCGKK